MEARPPCNLKILSLRETQFVSRRDNLFIIVGTSLNCPEIWIFSLRKRVVSFQLSDFRFQISERIQRDRRSKEILEWSVFSYRHLPRVVVGAPGRAPVMRGRGLPFGKRSWKLADFRFQLSSRSCRGASDARKRASHVRKIKEGASESMHPLFIG